MAFTAAELQKRHGLEGAPDPFPTLGSTAPRPTNKPSTPIPVDTSSSDAFPSLGPSAAPQANLVKPAISAWSAKPSTVKSIKGKPPAPGGLGRIGAPTAASHPFTDSFSIPSDDLAPVKVVNETVKKAQEQTGAMVESSTQMKTGLKTFLIRAADQKRLAYARRIIERGISKPVTITVDVPITTLGTIIGPKGATLKSITEATTCKIDIPKRETLPTYEPKEVEDDDEESEEPNVPISISGPSVACSDAKSKILALIANKVSQISTSIKTIPSSYYPFISKHVKTQGLDSEEVKIHIPPPAVWKALEKQGEEDESVSTKDLSIKIKGDREKVKMVVEEINRRYEELNDSLRELKISIPKRQHRFLVGTSAVDILDQTGCIVDLPPVEDPSDQCVIRGPQSSLIPALTLVMDKANAIAVEQVDLVQLHRPNTSDPLSHAKRVLRYLQRINRLRSIADTHGVKVYPPFTASIASGNVVVEVVGEDKGAVGKAKEEVAQAVKSIPPSAVTTLEIDPLVHSILIGKKGSKITTFETAHTVATLFPPASEESSDVALVYTGPLDSLPSDKKARDAKLKELLSSASTALEELAKGAADIKTETLDVDRKWHKFIIGPSGTILNAIIGEDQIVSVRVGSKAGSKEGSDDVIVRGPSTEVERVVEQILKIVEDAKNDDIINGHTVEFNVDKKHVPHLVGAAGGAINKLRESLGVKISFDDIENQKSSKKVMVACKIIGRKEAAEEAERRLKAQIEKLEDETTEVVVIKRAIQPALIGAGGKYAVRLEEKYGVKLSFPRDKDSPKPDEVTIRGGRKGVAAVKAELLEAAAFEAESRQTLTFTIPSKAVAQVVGKGGATINGIKDETGAMIDIDKKGDGETSVTVKGDKQAIAAAKKAVLAVVEEVGDDIQLTVTIDPKYHRSLIGPGGQKIRDLVVACGGPAEGSKQTGMVTFPKAGDEHPDQVRLRGDSKLVQALSTELTKQASILSQTIIIGVPVPSSHHASKIGRGGSALLDLQRKTGTTIHFPASRQYNFVGEISNTSELTNADPKDIVKVIGTKEACEAAAETLRVIPPERAQRNDSRGGRSTPDFPTKTVDIPSKYFHAIANQPTLIRQIRAAGGFLTIPQAPQKVEVKQHMNGNGLAAKTARIDLDAEDEEGEFELRRNYEDGDEGTSSWVVKAKEEDLETAVAVLEAAVEKAKALSHVGLLTGLPRSAFPRIIGSKGATISRLRAETGAEIQVGKDDDLITIYGDETSVVGAKNAILSIVSRPARHQY
ncbi:hypothetical protein M231_02183 [Tremella mesenterica]|uniref:K Homology domain-containing protein n=1 Tax=Tremella mesenterica TaxID=5217 RepID=A0A4Q1BRC9_TREME|nr:hypothetical protein M231_02183 [Tremella mesenterica]